MRLRCEEAERRLLASGESAITPVLTWTTGGPLASGFTLPEVYGIPVPVEIFTIRFGKFHAHDNQRYWTKVSRSISRESTIYMRTIWSKPGM